jgi:hypothetical protein
VAQRRNSHGRRDRAGFRAGGEPADQRMRTVPAPKRLPVVPGFEDLVYEPRPLFVVPDSRGRVLNWIHALAQPGTPRLWC